MYTTESIRSRLFEAADKKYAEFSGSLIPGSKPLIGVRIPTLKKYAAEIAKDDWRNFLANAGDKYFEEDMLKVLVVGSIKEDIETVLMLVKECIPMITNWSLNDSLCSSLKITKKHTERVWEFLVPYMNSDKEFENRFANIMLMDYFLTEKYVKKVLNVYKVFNHEAYYAKMGVAWAVATAFAKFPDETYEFMKEWQADDVTYNMAIRKMLESYRVSDEYKQILKNMKR